MQEEEGIFQYGFNEEQLKTHLKQLQMKVKRHENILQKQRKEIEVRPTFTNITEMIVLCNSLIEVDPTLGKLLKSKEIFSLNIDEKPLNSRGSELGIKINNLSQCITLIYQHVQSIEKKILDQQVNLRSYFDQKLIKLQESIESTNNKNSQIIMNVMNEIESLTIGTKIKLTEIQQKAKWQINDCKSKLANCVELTYIKDEIQRITKKMQKIIKEENLKQNSITPERLENIQQKIEQSQKYIVDLVTKTNYNVEIINNRLKNTVINKEEYQEDRLDKEKRFKLLNKNMIEIYNRVKKTEESYFQLQDQKQINTEIQSNHSKQIKRIHQVLNNIQIGEDLQKMLQKINPQQILAFDQKISQLGLNQDHFQKNIENICKEIRNLSLKSQQVNTLCPNTDLSNKITREDVQKMIDEYFIENQLMKKILRIETEFLELNNLPQIASDLSRKFARLQKQTNVQSVAFQMKVLEEYLKKEIYLIRKKVNEFENFFQVNQREGSKNYRTESKGITRKSFSSKKIASVNTLSFYKNSFQKEKK